ncbi:MAG: hypothetical protein ACJ72O_13765 [Marmoricola sp.]|jgi:hypothetical protein
MSHTTKRTERRHASEPPLPDALTTLDGDPIPVWDAEAADPIAYLASVMDLLPGSRARQAQVAARS